MIEARGLTKRYGSKLAVDDLTFEVRPGVVTGFLGPNGAGKSTTMRILLGLDRPTAGSARINGKRYDHLSSPLSEVGALLDAKDLHKGRTARKHLLALAQSNGIGRHRVDEVLDLTGLSDVAGQRIKGFSLGMSQRLGIAATMLGDPPILMFDEPVNGLDPEGIQWIRGFMRALAAEGRTIFVSSHLMSEMSLTAHHLIVIGRGKLLADLSTEEFIATHGRSHVRIKSPQADQMAALIAATGVEVKPVEGYLEVTGTDCAALGDLAAANGLTVHELFSVRSSLEDAFMEMTQDSVEYHAASPGSAPVPSTTTGG